MERNNPVKKYWFIAQLIEIIRYNFKKSNQLPSEIDGNKNVLF